jgi:hypothetical protein
MRKPMETSTKRFSVEAEIRTSNLLVASPDRYGSSPPAHLHCALKTDLIWHSLLGNFITWHTKPKCVGACSQNTGISLPASKCNWCDTTAAASE